MVTEALSEYYDHCADWKEHPLETIGDFRRAIAKHGLELESVERDDCVLWRIRKEQASKPREMLISAYTGPTRNEQVPPELRQFCEKWTDEMTGADEQLYQEQALYGHFTTAYWHPDTWTWSCPVHDSRSHLIVHAAHREPMPALEYLYALLDLEFGS